MKEVLAQKNGVKGRFSQKAWDTGNMQNDGWQRVGDVKVGDDGVAEEIVKVKNAKIEEIPVEAVQPFTEKPSPEIPDNKDEVMDEMKAFLKEEGIKFHPNIGYKKLKNKYDEVKK